MCSKYIYCTCICRKCIYCTDMRIDYVLCISSPGEELRVCTMYYRKNAHNQHQGVHGAAQEQCRQAPLAYQLLPPPSPSYTTSCYHTRELCFTARGFSARGEIPLNCSALTSHAGQAFNRPRPSLPPPHQTTVKHTRKASSCQLPASMPVDMAIENLSSGTERISAGVLQGGAMARLPRPLSMAGYPALFLPRRLTDSEATLHLPLHLPCNCADVWRRVDDADRSLISGLLLDSDLDIYP